MDVFVYAVSVFDFLGRVEAYVVYVGVSDTCDDILHPHRMRKGE
jgi:hypothetical protein